MQEIEELSASADLMLLTQAAREAGRIAMRYFRDSPEVWMKSGNSPVSEADLAVDRFLHGELMAARPDYGWISEEAAASMPLDRRGPTFVVDPIDGTRAFIDGSPTWCISIAVVVDGRPAAGVLDCPAKEEIYAAFRGGGAKLNRERIAVGEPGELPVIAGPKAMLAMLPGELRDRMRTHPYIPSLAYRIAMVANGALDATYVKPNAHDWDLAAADLILEEAGGSVLDSSGKLLRYAGGNDRHGELIAGSGELLKSLSLPLRLKNRRAAPD